MAAWCARAMESNEMSCGPSVTANMKPLSWLGMKPVGMVLEQVDRADQHQQRDRQRGQAETHGDAQRALVPARQPVEPAFEARL